uniref:Uncharacterized protein n=1 Tax=Pararge aegeria TaxID=116150 RepID=S4PBS1_9NEOP
MFLSIEAQTLASDYNITVAFLILTNYSLIEAQIKGDVVVLKKKEGGMLRFKICLWPYIWPPLWATCASKLIYDSTTVGLYILNLVRGIARLFSRPL